MRLDRAHGVCLPVLEDPLWTWREPRGAVLGEGACAPVLAARIGWCQRVSPLGGDIDRDTDTAGETAVGEGSEATVTRVRSTRSASRRTVTAAATAVAGFGLLLAGCGSGQISQTADQQSGVNGAVGYLHGMALNDVQFVAPAGTAYQAGSNARLLMTVSNATGSNERLSGSASTAFSGVDYVGSRTVPAGGALSAGTDRDDAAVTQVAAPPVGRGKPVLGSIRVTMTGLHNTLYAGQTVPIQFQFSGAGSITLNVPIGAPAGTGKPAPTPPGQG